MAVKEWIATNLDSGSVTKECFAGSSSWSSAYTYETESGTKYFVKVALGRDKSMFEGEALGLSALYGECDWWGRAIDIWGPVTGHAKKLYSSGVCRRF